MTEAEWLSETTPFDMFEHIKKEARSRRAALPHRQLRLYGCAACRLVWPLLTEEASRKGVEVSERFADGLAKRSELGRARETAAAVALALKPAREGKLLVATGKHPPSLAAEMATWASAESIQDVVEMLSTAAAGLVLALKTRAVDEKEIATLREALRRLDRLFRDIFGNPFHPMPSIAPGVRTWNDGAVVKMAKVIYDERAFDRLPILADALEDAGCDDTDILGHCRSAELHVRGCWLVDLLRTPNGG
jgi:hypothetical protein